MNSGHLFRAAAAHFIATGKRNLLNIALKNANLLVQVFGPETWWYSGSWNCRNGIGAVIRITGEKIPGSKLNFSLIAVEKSPIRSNLFCKPHSGQQTEAVGHGASRPSGAPMWQHPTGNKEYIDANWQKSGEYSTATKSFTSPRVSDGFMQAWSIRFDYELSNLTAYNETALPLQCVLELPDVFASRRSSNTWMCSDRSPHNNVISGIGLDGIATFGLS